MLLKSAEVAELLRVHPKHVYRLLRRGLPARRVGGEWRFDRDQVLEWAGSVPEHAAAAVSSPPALATPAAPPFVAANGDVVIELLLAQVNSESPMLGFVQADSGQAMALLADDRVLAAGCHGDGPPPRLGALRLARIHLVDREIGLAWRPEAAVPTIRSLARLTIAARPPSAGVMVHLRAALARENARLGTHRVYASHRDVVCAVLSRESDVGLVTRAWAERAGLAFQRLASEPYGLAVFAERLGHAAVTRICEVAQSDTFREVLGQVPGYDPSAAGDIRYDPEPGEPDPAGPRRSGHGAGVSPSRGATGRGGKTGSRRRGRKR